MIKIDDYDDTMADYYKENEGLPNFKSLLKKEVCPHNEGTTGKYCKICGEDIFNRHGN